MNLSYVFLLASLGLSPCEVAPTFPIAELVISPTGGLSLDGEPVAEQELHRELKAVRDGKPRMMLNIRVDMQNLPLPQIAAVEKAAGEAGFTSTNLTSYREQEQARCANSQKRDLLLSMLYGVLGVWATGVVVAAAVGLYMDFRDSHHPGLAGWGWGMNVLIMEIYAVPSSFAAGLLTGALSALWVRLHRKAVVAAPAP